MQCYEQNPVFILNSCIEIREGLEYTLNFDTNEKGSTFYLSLTDTLRLPPNFKKTWLSAVSFAREINWVRVCRQAVNGKIVRREQGGRHLLEK